MAFDVTALTTYVEENKDQLVTDSVLLPKTVALVTEAGNLMTGIKDSEQINEIETDVIFQDGSTCGWNASGTTSLTQRKVTVGHVKINEALCPKALAKKYTAKAMAVGSMASREEVPAIFAKAYTGKKVAKINEANEKAVWQGDTNSGDANLNKYDGYIKLIKATSTPIITNARVGAGTITATTGAATVVGVSTLFTTQVAVGDKVYSGTTLVGTVLTITDATHLTFAANGAVAVTGGAYNIVPATSTHFAAPITSITTANIVAVLQGVYGGIPLEVVDKEDARIFVGMDTFTKYTLALTNANLFHYVADKNVMDAMKLHGTNVTIQAVPGLNATNEIYGMRISNMYVGTDMENEEDKFEMFYAKEAGEVRFDAEFKLGVQVAFPNEIARFQLLA